MDVTKTLGSSLRSSSNLLHLYYLVQETSQEVTSFVDSEPGKQTLQSLC